MPLHSTYTQKRNFLSTAKVFFFTQSPWEMISIQRVRVPSVLGRWDYWAKYSAKLLDLVRDEDKPFVSLGMVINVIIKCREIVSIFQGCIHSWIHWLINFLANPSFCTLNSFFSFCIVCGVFIQLLFRSLMQRVVFMFSLNVLIHSSPVLYIKVVMNFECHSDLRRYLRMLISKED